MFKNISIILLSIIFSSTAHLFLKKGVAASVGRNSNNEAIYAKAWYVVSNPWILSGMLLHVLALAVWLWALSKVDISFAYPFLALGYVLVSFMAWAWLGEELSAARLWGMGVIIIGILILAKSG